jgi:hypothetical protein
MLQTCKPSKELDGDGQCALDSFSLEKSDDVSISHVVEFIYKSYYGNCLNL